MSGTGSSRHPERSSASRPAGQPIVEIVNDGGGPTLVPDQPTVISNLPPLPPQPVSVPPQADVWPGGPPKLGPGTVLGQFELLDCVGGGGMGRVFRARDTGLDRVVALKVLSPEQAADPETLLRFRNEARSAARLNHDNIVQVYHVGEAQGLPYIVFEFIDGVNVRALVEQKGPLGLAEAISYTFQVAEALAHAASRQVVHRDVKPSNILIMPEGQVKLIDMGLARLQRLDQQAADLTASGVTLGTFDYISPEQARDPRNADVRSDIYSLGCTLFFMLTGRPPFPAGTVLQKLLQHQGDEPADVRQFRPELPEEVSRVVRKMMAKDPRYRYQDPRKLMEALGALAEHIGLRPLGPGKTIWVAPREPVVSPIERHLPWAIPVVALVVIVLVLHFLWSAAARQGSAWSAAWVGASGESTGSEDISEPGPGEATGQGSASKAVKPGEGSDKSLTPAEPTAKRPGAEPGKGEAAAPRTERSEPVKPMPPGAVSPPEGAGPSGDAMAARPEPLSPPAAASPKAAPPETSPGKPLSDAASASASAEPASAKPGAAAPAEARGVAPPTEPAAKRTGVVVVDGKGQGENRYATLAAACSAATTGCVIELCYNGRQKEQWILLPGVELTIRAGEGFQPIVVFRPSELDPAVQPRSMITLNGSRLTLISLAIELDVPRDIAAESWSLFDVAQAGSVGLEKCSLTIRNASDQQTAYHQEVAFFRAKEMPQPALLLEGDSPAPARPVEIRLADCIARGEAVLLRTEGLRPVNLTWDNGLLTTTERLLVADPAHGTPPASPPTVLVTLKHLTAAARSGLWQFNHPQLVSQPLAAKIDCRDSIILGFSAGPLLEQVGSATGEQFRQRIAYSGDRNFFVGLSNFWSIRFLSPEISPESMTFDVWRTQWKPHEGNSRSEVHWKQLAPASRPPSAQTAADYALSDTADNPPRKAASDARDAGMDAERLRPLPQEPGPPDKAGQGALPAISRR